MASLISRGLTQLKSKETRDYLTSTHFWGPVAHWGLPLAAIAELKTDLLVYFLNIILNHGIINKSWFNSIEKQRNT
jgi:hypothetical protein